MSDNNEVIDVPTVIDVQTEITQSTGIIQSIGRPRQLDMNILNIITALAPTWKKSMWFGIREPEQAIVLMAKAYELGFPIMSANDYFDVITTNNGTKIFVKPKAALALIYRSGLLKKMIIEDRKNACYCYMQRRDSGQYGYGFEFTIDMAKRAGIYRQGKTGPSAWEGYPELMLHYRAIGIVAGIVFTDVLAGMSVSDYIIDVEKVDEQ